MITISKPKLLAIFLILVTASSSFYLGQVLGTPAPTKTLICEPGGCGGNNLPCSDNVYLDGTTPVDSVAGSSQIVGTVGQDMGTFLNSIALAGDNVCFQPGRYQFTTTWILQNNVTAWGLTNPRQTILSANANSISIIGVTSTTTDTIGVRISGLGFSANGKTNIVGINFNMSLDENTLHNQWTDVEFQGTGFTYCAILDGNEDSVFGPAYIDNPGTCDISYKTIVGTGEIDKLVYGQPAGTAGALHVAGNTIIRDSVLNQIIIEDQRVSQVGGAGTYNTDSSLLDVSSTFLSNGSPVAGRIIKKAQGDTSTVFTMRFVGCYIGVPTSGYFIGLPGPANLIIQELSFIDNYWTGGAGSQFIFNNAQANGAIRIYHLHWINNQVPTLAATKKGDYSSISSSGFGYFFEPEPAGFNQSSPAYANHPTVPATGIGNAVRNDFPWPITIYENITSSAGVVLNTGTHIIDCVGDQCLNNGSTYSSSDKLLSGNPSIIHLYPGEKIYFVTNAPYSWLWYGEVW